MNSNLHSTEHSNIEHYSNFEYQLENMVSKLIEEPTMTNDLNFKDVPYTNENEAQLTFISTNNQNESFNTLSLLPVSKTNKFQRTNTKYSTFTGTLNCQCKFILKSNQPSKQLSHSSCCLNKYSFYNNNSQSQHTVNPILKEKEIEILLEQIQPQLAQNEQITTKIYQSLQGNFINAIKSHKGSRLFQQYLTKTNYSIIYLIYQELQYDLVGIISDIYANYFFTKFYSCLHRKDRIEIISIITNHFVDLSCNCIGVFPIQNIIEQANTNIEKKLISKIIIHNINKLCIDLYGCHVIAKIISCFEYKYIEPILNYIISNLSSLTKDPNGICVIKALIVYIANLNDCHDNIYIKFYNFLINDFISLVHNQHGNQVIKTLVQEWDLNLINNLLVIIQSNSIELSIGKFSSTIIESFIEKNPFLLELYIGNLLNNNMLFEIMDNIYGKYVIQKALKISTGNTHHFLLNYIVNNYKRFTNTKNLSQWKNLLEQYYINI